MTHAAAGPSQRRSVLALAGLLILVGAVWGRSPEQPPAPGNASIDAALPPRERGRALARFSTGLVQQAESGKVHATAFRIDAAHYRETLRDLVTDNAQRPDSERLPQPLILDMVRMTALLQSAAQCQTGRYIVCPPDLLTQMHRQQALIEQGLAALDPRR
jgi:hypothetical protein